MIEKLKPCNFCSDQHYVNNTADEVEENRETINELVGAVNGLCIQQKMNWKTGLKNIMGSMPDAPIIDPAELQPDFELFELYKKKADLADEMIKVFMVENDPDGCNATILVCDYVGDCENCAFAKYMELIK